jgi:hypothetical protein
MLLILPYNLKNTIYELVFSVLTISYANYLMQTLGYQKTRKESLIAVASRRDSLFAVLVAGLHRLHCVVPYPAITLKLVLSTLSTRKEWIGI